MLSILIVSRERSGGHYLALALNESGYPDVTVKISPREALAGFVRHNYDLMIISSALEPPGALETIRQIRAGETVAPRDLVIVLVDCGGQPENDAAIAPLGINAFTDRAVSAKSLDETVMHAIAHHYLALDAIAAMDSNRSAPSENPGARYSGEVFCLPAGALVEGMLLEDDITIHGHLLIPAGTVLHEAHLRVIESTESVLEKRELRVRFSSKAS